MRPRLMRVSAQQSAAASAAADLCALLMRPIPDPAGLGKAGVPAAIHWMHAAGSTEALRTSAVDLAWLGANCVT